MHILRSDDPGALIREYADSSWQSVGEAVVEVLQETLDPQEWAEMTPEELIHQGYVQGVGHLIIALLAREVRLELTEPHQRVEKISRAADPRHSRARED